MADFKLIHIPETDSTNRYLRELADEDDVCVWTDYQTAGRGCGTNSWESERGRNLLFSLRCHPRQVAANRQFVISMAISVAIARAVGTYGVHPAIKWPNDIYVGDRKLCGILIENRLSGSTIRESIIGVGLNVNQTRFVSDAPNPVSLQQLTGKSVDREELLDQILQAFDISDPSVSARYRQQLYRREGFFTYEDRDGRFEAQLAGVEDDGMLVLCDREGRTRRYAFKEVKHIIHL